MTENRRLCRWGEARGTLQRRSDLCIPRNETARPRSRHFFHIHIPTIGQPILLHKLGGRIVGIYKSLTDI
jgi:hypothetical protein